MKLSSPNSFVYPYGTAEKFPAMANSDGLQLSQTAHYYMECSNKGTCDRTKGECQCLDGYEGVACQRASCPGTPTCSGHGTCQSIKQLAAKDNYNVYNLWDKDSTMGCLCDSGYGGPDCSERQCKYGVDPLYLDDTSTIKYSEYNFATILAVPNSVNTLPTDMTKIFTNGLSDTANGEWAIRFYDANGEDWLTDPIKGYATCDDILNALYALPNNAVPLNSVYCQATAKTSKSGSDAFKSIAGDAQWQNVPGGSTTSKRDGLYDVDVGSTLAFWEMGADEASLLQLLLQGEINGLVANYAAATDKLSSSISTPVPSTVKLVGAVYNLRFLGNPGKLKQPEIEIYLDGKRPSLLPSTLVSNGKVITKVWTDGQQGENVDYFADHCDGLQVTVKAATASDAAYLADSDGLKANDKEADWQKTLKRCLGASDFNDYNNVADDVFNWDTGNKYFPHLIKLVKSPTIYTDGGYYVALYYAADANTFKLLNKFQAPGAAASTKYDVYTTKGTLAMVSENSQASFGFGSRYIYTHNSAFDPKVLNSFSGDLSCDLYSGTKDVWETKGSAAEYNAAKKKNIFPNVFLSDSSPDLDNDCVGSATPETCIKLSTYIAAAGTKGIATYVKDGQGTLTAKTAKFYQGAVNSYCLNKGDKFVLLNFEKPFKSSAFLNIYTVDNVKTIPSLSTLTGSPDPNMFMRHVITSDISTNWAHHYGDNTADAGKYFVYKFMPAKASSYEYVAECSNRGTCSRDTGVCECFPGYSSDNCHTQSSLAL
jgi:hypothetical protein